MNGSYISSQMGPFFHWLAECVEPLLSHLGYYQVKKPLPPGTPVLKFNDRDVLAAAVMKVMQRCMTSQSPAAIEEVADVANQIIAEIEGTVGLSISDQVMRYHHDILGHRQLNYVLACGIAAYWELSVKNLAEKLGVPVFEERTSEKKKSPSLRELEPIIGDLKKAAPKLDAGITKRKNLRDALIHANFHQLKTRAQEGKPRAEREQLQGAVWRLRLSDQSIEHMSEMHDVEKIKRIGLFGWFLEVASSEILEQTIIELKTAVDDLQALIRFKSMCFNQRAGLFEKMFIYGERLSQTEIDLFYEEENMCEITKLFVRLNKLMKK